MKARPSSIAARHPLAAHPQVYYMCAYRKRAMGMLVYVDQATIQGLKSLHPSVTLNPLMQRVAFEQFEAWPLDLEKLRPRMIPLPDKFEGTLHVSDHCDAHPPTWATPEELRAWKLRFFIPATTVLPRRANIAYEPGSPVEADLNERLSLEVAPKFATEQDWNHWREGAIAALEKRDAKKQRLSRKATSPSGIPQADVEKLEKLERQASIAAPKAGARAPEVRTVDPRAVDSIDASFSRTTTPCDEPESLSCLLHIVVRNTESWKGGAEA